MSKKAILQVADTGPLESLVVMLRAVGYECFLPSQTLQDELKRVCGRDSYVVSPTFLMHTMGYDAPMRLPEARTRDVKSCDLFVDVKAHRAYPHLVRVWPNLAGKVLWYRINGGQPQHVIKPDGEDCGDEVNPPCPVLTPNQWYRKCPACKGTALDEGGGYCRRCGDGRERKDYCCWPPFYRFDEYEPTYPRIRNYHPPVCLVHNLRGWGYGALVDAVHALGVYCYGDGSPDGLIQHRQVPRMLSQTKAMVHLKSNDAPGYALYEALAAACPVICTRRLIWRCRMQDLLIPDQTCLVFDRETHEGLTPEDVISCREEIQKHLIRLDDPDENIRIGRAGRERLKSIMWSESREEDVASLRTFLERHFP